MEVKSTEQKVSSCAELTQKELREMLRNRSHQLIVHMRSGGTGTPRDWNPKRTGNTLSCFIIFHIWLALVSSWSMNVLLRGDPSYNPIKREWTLRTRLRWNYVFYL